MIRTTIHIDSEVHRRLIKAAEKQQEDIEDIILTLLRFFSKKYRKEIIAMLCPVKYQERKPESFWECVHVNWFGEEYEFLIDLRKLHKQSVSRLIALMVMEYIDENGSFIDLYADNYHHQPYFISKFTIQNMIGCIFLWGKPIKSLPD